MYTKAGNDRYVGGSGDYVLYQVPVNLRMCSTEYQMRYVCLRRLGGGGGQRHSPPVPVIDCCLVKMAVTVVENTAHHLGSHAELHFEV